MEQKAITDYYNLHAKDKLYSYLHGNKRLDLAWETLCKYAPLKLNDILEIGCGVGDMAYQMSKRWGNSSVVGIDLSDTAIMIASDLFGSDRIKYLTGSLNEVELNKTFDLVVLFDVYEHIESGKRNSFNEKLNSLIRPGGYLFLSIPAPIYQDFIKKHHPEGLQPVDESITLDILHDLASKCNAELLFYKNVDIHFEGDYTHIVFKKKDESTRFERPVNLDKPLALRAIQKTFLYLIYTNPLFSRKRLRIIKAKRKLKHIDL
jgi:SAM-dependent methyltransferase